MPQTGETKTVNGTTAIWDGMTWRHVDGPLPTVKNPAADLQQPSAHDMGLAQAFLDKPSVTDKPALLTDKTDPTGGAHISPLEDPARYLGHAAKGIARGVNPVNAVKSLFGLPGAVYKGYTEDIPALFKDPSLLKEAPAAAGEFAQNPEAVGETLGSALLGERAPALTEAAISKGPGIVGRGVSAVGRGAESLGTSKIAKKAQMLAPFEAMTGHIPTAIASAVVPPVLEYGGKLAQKAGGALEGLKLSLKGKAAAAAPVAEAAPVVPETPLQLTRRIRDEYRAANQPKVDASIQGLEQAIQPDIAPPDSAVPEGNSPAGVQRGLAQVRSKQANLPNHLNPDTLPGIGARAEQMGRQSVNSLATGYENVPEGGIRSNADIDAMLASRRPNTIEPNAFTGNPATQGLEASLAELRQKAGPQNPAFTEFGSTNDSPLPGEDGSYDLGEISDKPALTNEQLDRIAGDKEAIRNLFNNHFGSKVAGR